MAHISVHVRANLDFRIEYISWVAAADAPRIAVVRVERQAVVAIRAHVASGAHTVPAGLVAGETLPTRTHVLACWTRVHWRRQL